MIPIINRYTCRPSQIKMIVNKLKRMRLQPILDKVNENGMYHKENFMDMKKIIKDNPNNTFALKFSSFNIEKDLKLSYNYASEIIKYAKKNNSKILLDAEMNKIQSDIYKLSDQLISENNTNDFPVVYKTYQMYRKDAYNILKNDLSKNRNHSIGIKLVRGAYYYQDKSTNKLFSTIEETHKNYNDAIKLFSQNYKPNDMLICATHNNYSIQYVKELIKKDNINNVSFAHLMGMSNKLSEELIEEGYHVYKYVPYGNFIESIPYLIRRLYENYPMIVKLFE
jgi:hypothetical protein